ncbi:hypothetical protein [Bradyrhizobium sp. th.b2]|nr:hypothetical protein [Bradyrhizobium sp. th.b2]
MIGRLQLLLEARLERRVPVAVIALERIVAKINKLRVDGFCGVE